MAQAAGHRVCFQRKTSPKLFLQGAITLQEEIHNTYVDTYVSTEVASLQNSGEVDCLQV